MSLGLLSGGVEAGALEHELNAVVSNPLEVASVALSIDRVFLAVNDDGVVGGLDVNRGAVNVLEHTVGAVVLEQISQSGRRRQIVDSGDLDVGSFAALLLQFENAAEGETTNTTEAVDTNLYCHVVLPLGTASECSHPLAWLTNTVYSSGVV